VDINKTTRLARLLISPAPVVYDELKAYSIDVRANPYGAASEELEAKLAAREDPLIDLGLASYGASTELIGELYQKAKTPPTDDADATYKQGLRLAVLANETIASKGFLHRFPENTIGEAEVSFVVKDADWIEAETLIQNPTLAPEVLIALYRGDKFFEGVDDKRRMQLVAMSARNERVHTCNDDEHGPDFASWDIHKAIFGMLETVPTSKPWLSNLDFLLSHLDPDQVKSPDSLDDVLERWRLDENGRRDESDDSGKYTDTGLPDREEFRCLIAALYGRTYNKQGVVIHGSADDEDIARRCAYYGNANLDVKAIQQGFKKDDATFVFAAVLNDSILLNRKTRRELEECIGGGYLHRYRRRCEQLHKRWPSFDPRPTVEWMVEEEPTPDQPVVRVQEQVTNLADRLARIERGVALLPWLLLGLAVLVLWQR
jgi:hypothetical protein